MLYSVDWFKRLSWMKMSYSRVIEEKEFDIMSHQFYDTNRNRKAKKDRPI